jgi:hypothetical protein
LLGFVGVRYGEGGRKGGLTAPCAAGYSDPYCVLQAGQQKHVTKIKKKTLNPLWNESFLLCVLSLPLSFCCWAVGSFFYNRPAEGPPLATT